MKTLTFFSLFLFLKNTPDGVIKAILIENNKFLRGQRRARHDRLRGVIVSGVLVMFATEV